MQSKTQTQLKRWALVGGIVCTFAACGSQPLSVGEQRSQARAPDGTWISWQEHRIDDELVNGGVAIRGGDGLKLADIDRDGWRDVVSVHEDSNHLRIAFGSPDPERWELITVAAGGDVGAIEDVAVGDLNGDGWPDLVAACEEAHLAYFQNPGADARSSEWPSLVPAVTRNRGSWLRVAAVDMDGDGRIEVLGANKGFADVVRTDGGVPDLPTSLFWLDGEPLTQDAWREQVLMRDGIPNHVLPVDIDRDGDWDVLAASRTAQKMMIIENRGRNTSGELDALTWPIEIASAAGLRGAANAFNAEFADVDGDGRVDLFVNATEFDDASQGWAHAGLVWLRQPERLSEPWQLHRVGHTLPDWVIGIGLADIDGDGDMDAVTGGYSGLNIIRGGYSGASRDEDDPEVTRNSTVARIAWFENPGEAAGAWRRHDISRRVRGMYDGFEFADLDQDGDVDIVTTRGNSGVYDGVAWLEQRRNKEAQAALIMARQAESRTLPLPDADWRNHYGERVTFRAPNKDAQLEAMKESR